MKMKTTTTLRTLLVILVCWIGQGTLHAQPPGGRRGPGGGFEEMIKREKQNLYEKVTDLSDDQKLLLDGIYDEYSASLKEKMEEAFKTRDREKMKATMGALNAEKDGLIKDVLNDNQYAIYEEISINNRNRRRSRPAEEKQPPAEEEPESSPQEDSND